MRLPTFKIRALMIAVAVLAVLMVVAPPWWRYWFQSPWRLMTIPAQPLPNGRQIGGATLFYDIRKPLQRQRFGQVIHNCDAVRAKYTLERFATFPRSRFPTFSDVDIRRIDPTSRD